MSKPSTPSGNSSRPSTAASSLISENIRVILRLRPPLNSDTPDHDSSNPSSPRVQETEFSTFITPEDEASSFENSVSSFTAAGDCNYSKNYGEETKTFKYNSCRGPTVPQHEVYSQDVQDIVTGVLDGYHGTVLAYGQTGSGKTHTMMGPEEHPGIIPRSLQHMFAAAAASPDEISFSICYLQIYCEVIYDMLSPTTSTNLSIREKNSQLYVEGLSVVAVDSVDKCLSLIAEGNKRRATSSTLLNDQSSRSHASLIVTCTRRSQKSNATTSVAVSNLVMVDLAGSERAKQSGVKFQQFEELKAINLSLSALGNCVSALGAGKAHIPYRDSKLTRLLQHTLGGNSRTVLICCARPGNDDGGETYSTLMFAKRASNVKVMATLNVVLDYEKLYKELQSDKDGTEDVQHKLEMENANLRIQLEKSEEARNELQGQRDAASNQLTSVEKGFEASLQALGGSVPGDVVEAIEGVSEKWRGEIEAMQHTHQHAMASAKMKFEQQLAAYKAAADSARQEEDEAGIELEKAQASHLSTLNDVQMLTDKIKVLERDSGGRIAELLDELNASNLALEEAEGATEAQNKMYMGKINELVQRLDELDKDQGKRKQMMGEMVSREAVLEMESLFTETIEKLMDRVNMLEGKQKENQLDAEIGGVGERSEKSRASNLDPQAKRLLEQMERNQGKFGGGVNLAAGAGGGGARMAPGRLRARKQAF